ncbi:MAG: IgGFc-binding protein [Bacteroidetes bacterium]|nr:IgGFc-binding protein [Bacteroidota bacterium]MCL1968318.1 IgGFc-binding protein [Bacteroidota bacterium]
MNKIYTIFRKMLPVIAAIVLCSTSFRLSAQSSMKGKEFWVTFGARDAMTPCIKIVSEVNTTVRLEFTEKKSHRDVSITANIVEPVTFTPEEKGAVNHGYNYYPPAAGSLTTSKSLHIISPVNITVYAGEFSTGSSDATAILPVSVLGMDYYHAGYCPTIESLGADRYSRDGFMIIATQNGTNIYKDGVMVTSSSLNAGQVYRYYGNGCDNTPVPTSVSGIDLTGTHITANKPVAYFSIASLVGVPATYRYGDVFFEQLFPVETWGTEFFVPSTVQSKMRIRVIAAHNGTNLTIPGIVINNTPTGSVLKNQTGIMGPIVREPANPISIPIENNPISGNRPTGSQAGLTGLQAGQYIEIDVGSAANGCYISSNKPVMVVNYMVSSGSSSVPDHTYNTPAQQGDPSIGWIPPMEQYTHNVCISRFFMSSGTFITDKHFAQIVTPTANKLSTTVVNNGTTTTLSSSSNWKDNAFSGLSYYSYQLTNDNTYKIDNPKGVVVGGYGYGEVETYYYLAGSAARSLYPTLIVNGDYYDIMKDTTYAHCDTMIFEATTLVGAITHVVWKINGVEQTDYTSTLIWRTVLPNGHYFLEAEITMDDGRVCPLETSFSISGCCSEETRPAVNIDFIKPVRSSKRTEERK